MLVSLEISFNSLDNRSCGRKWGTNKCPTSFSFPESWFATQLSPGVTKCETFYFIKKRFNVSHVHKYSLSPRQIRGLPAVRGTTTTSPANCSGVVTPGTSLENSYQNQDTGV